MLDGLVRNGLLKVAGAQPRMLGREARHSCAVHVCVGRVRRMNAHVILTYVREGETDLGNRDLGFGFCRFMVFSLQFTVQALGLRV